MGSKRYQPLIFLLLTQFGASYSHNFIPRTTISTDGDVEEIDKPLINSPKLTLRDVDKIAPLYSINPFHLSHTLTI